MLRGELGHRVHHLGFEPQAKLHPERMHVIRERSEAVGPLGIVDEPIAESRAIIGSSAEPAVVEHEALDADGCRGLGER